MRSSRIDSMIDIRRKLAPVSVFTKASTDP